MLFSYVLVLFLSVYKVASYNFTGETCVQEFNKLVTELSLPTSLLGVTVHSDDLEYILFTKQYPVEEIRINNTTKYLINPKLDTKIIISGWLEGWNIKWVLELRDIYLRKGPYNIIVFNWDEYCYMHYFYSTEISGKLGKNLGNFIVSLVKDIGLDLNKVHIIGHSLGAHIAGFTGQQVIKRLYRRIGRISALDAAGPIFIFNTESCRLDKNDANFVDAIHTNNFIFGYNGPIGTVDVFVNSAVFQPGCPILNGIIKPLATCEEVHKFLFCSHVKSIEVWKRSIDANLIARHIITGYPIVIGENTSRSSSGFYCLQIRF